MAASFVIPKHKHGHFHRFHSIGPVEMSPDWILASLQSLTPVYLRGGPLETYLRARFSQKCPNATARCNANFCEAKFLGDNPGGFSCCTCGADNHREIGWLVELIRNVRAFPNREAFRQLIQRLYSNEVFPKTVVLVEIGISNAVKRTDVLVSHKFGNDRIKSCIETRNAIEALFPIIAPGPKNEVAFDSFAYMVVATPAQTLNAELQQALESNKAAMNEAVETQSITDVGAIYLERSHIKKKLKQTPVDWRFAKMGWTQRYHFGDAVVWDGQTISIHSSVATDTTDRLSDFQLQDVDMETAAVNPT